MNCISCRKPLRTATVDGHPSTVCVNPDCKACMKPQGEELKPEPRAHKYGAVATTVDGIRFDSKREAARYSELKLLESQGAISNLTLQEPFAFRHSDILIATYKADFLYWENGERVVEDVKGMKTPMYRMKKKMMKAFYGIDIREVTA